VRIKAIRVAKLTLWFLLLTGGSVHAQAPQAAPEIGSPLSEIAHDFTAWLSHVTGASANHRRAALSPPLPRPRPAAPVPAPVASNKDASELASVPVAPQKKTPAVLIND
jgi:hypothetical protein